MSYEQVLAAQEKMRKAHDAKIFAMADELDKLQLTDEQRRLVGEVLRAGYETDHGRALVDMVEHEKMKAQLPPELDALVAKAFEFGQNAGQCQRDCDNMGWRGQAYSHKQAYERVLNDFLR